MNPDVFYVLDNGPRKGESRPAVIVRRQNEKTASLIVFVDGDFDGFGGLAIWRPSVQFNEFGAPGTMHIVGPGCVTYRDHPHSDGSIAVDRSDPLNPRFKYAEIAETELDETSAPDTGQSPEIPLNADTYGLAMSVSRDADVLNDVKPEEREKAVEAFLADIQQDYGDEGVEIFNRVVYPSLQKHWEISDMIERETAGHTFNTSPLSEKPVATEGSGDTVAVENNTESELPVISQESLKPKQLIPDDKLKEIFGDGSEEVKTPQIGLEQPADGVK